MEVLVLDLKLPAKGTTASKFVPNINIQFTILKSDAGLSKAQHAHTDELLPFSLGSNTKFFDFITITGIEKESLFYIQPLGMEPKLVLLERGDTLFFRNDIPHAGTENLTDRQNVRLHSFITIVNYGVKQSKGMTTKKVDWNSVPNVEWDDKEFTFKVCKSLN